MYLFEEAKGCTIHTMSCQSCVVHYPKKGAGPEGEWLDHGLVETFVTKIQDDSVKTVPMEALD